MQRSTPVQKISILPEPLDLDLPETKEEIPHLKITVLQNRTPLKAVKFKYDYFPYMWTCTLYDEEYILEKCNVFGTKASDGGLGQAAHACVMGLFARFFDKNQPDIRIVKNENNEYFILSKRIKGFLTFHERYALDPETTEDLDKPGFKVPKLTRVAEFIKNGQIINLGKIVATSFILDERNVGNSCVGFAPIKIEEGNPLFSLIQVNRGKNRRLEVTKEKPPIHDHLPTANDFVSAPYLERREQGYHPKNWFDRYVNHVMRPDGCVIDSSQRKDKRFRFEFNQTFFEFDLLMYGLFKKLISAVLGKHPLAKEYEKFFVSRQKLTNIALKAMPNEEWSFAKFLSANRENEIQHFIYMLNSFYYNGILVFKFQQTMRCCGLLMSNPFKQQVSENIKQLLEKSKKVRKDLEKAKNCGLREAGENILFVLAPDSLDPGSLLPGTLNSTVTPSTLPQRAHQTASLDPSFNSPIRADAQVFLQKKSLQKAQTAIIIGPEFKPELKDIESQTPEQKLQQHYYNFNKEIGDVSKILNQFYTEMRSDFDSNKSNRDKLVELLMTFGPRLNSYVEPLNKIINDLDRDCSIEQAKYIRLRMVIDFQQLINKCDDLREEIETTYTRITSQTSRIRNLRLI